MAVSVQSLSISYVGDGTSKDFSVPFYFIAQGDLEVMIGGVSMTLNSDYTVTGTLDPKLNVYSNGGVIHFTAAPASNANVYITRMTGKYQPATFNPGDPMMAGTVEEAYDRLCVLIQELAPGFMGLLQGPPSGTPPGGVNSWFIVYPAIAGTFFGYVYTTTGWKAFAPISF
jgi:hypothetical protein